MGYGGDHGPIEEKHRQLMNSLGRGIDDLLNGKGVAPGARKFGFALLVFDLNNTGGRMNYASNSNREDMIAAMKELLAKFEGRYHETEAQQ